MSRGIIYYNKITIYYVFLSHKHSRFSQFCVLKLQLLYIPFDIKYLKIRSGEIKNFNFKMFVFS